VVNLSFLVLLTRKRILSKTILTFWMTEHHLSLTAVPEVGLATTIQALPPVVLLQKTPQRMNLLMLQTLDKVAMKLLVWILLLARGDKIGVASLGLPEEMMSVWILPLMGANTVAVELLGLLEEMMSV
jgi:hypothetical protein